MWRNGVKLNKVALTNATLRVFYIPTLFNFSANISISFLTFWSIIARELKGCFSQLFSEETSCFGDVDGYDGVVYKYFKGDVGFSTFEQSYLQDPLRISSLLYGLLRPFDLINHYRMEGFIRLVGSDELVDRSWRDGTLYDGE